MIDGSEKRTRQLAFELQNSRVFEKRSKQVPQLDHCMMRKHVLAFWKDRYRFYPPYPSLLGPTRKTTVLDQLKLLAAPDTHHIVVACSPAESNFPVNIAIFSPASFLSLLLECCNVRARASFSAHPWASRARSSAHFKGGTLCIERNLLCVSSDCFENDPFGEEVAELDGVNLSAEKKKWCNSFFPSFKTK